MNSYNECKAIVELDLDPIKVKLMHKESGEGWTLKQANQVEKEYRRFLYLTKIFPAEMAAPSMDVDTFWHYHILDTMKYARDCEAVFGYFLHHFPYVGLRGEDDLAAHEKAGERMGELYEQTFGEPYRSALAGDTEPQAATAWSMSTVNQGRVAWSMSTAGRDKTAWSMSTAGRDKTAWSMSTVDQPKAAATAWSMSTGDRGTTAWSMSTAGRDTTAWSMSTVSANGKSKQDETDPLTRAGGRLLSKDAIATVNDDGISMNAFFSTRPRLTALAEAN